MTRTSQAKIDAITRTVATFLPPALVDEAGWDILLALHGDRTHQLSLDKLAAVVSIPRGALDLWLEKLEQSRLISGSRNSLTGEIRALLTQPGRELLDRYLSATSDLQAGAHP